MPRLTIIVVVALLAPRVADAGPQQDAKHHVARATQLHKDGNYSEALVELEAANRLDPKPELLYAIGQVHVKLGRCDEAIRFYDRYLATKPKPRAATLARQAIQACKTNPPPAAPEPTPEPPPAEPAKPAAIEPSPHKPPPEPAPAPAPAPAVEPAPAPTASLRAETRAVPRYRDFVGIGLATGGVIAGVAAALIYSGARSDVDAVPGAATYERGEDLADRASRKRTYAAVIGAGGAVLIGVGLVHIFAFDRVEERPVAVVPTTGGAAITWSGRF